MKLKPDWLKTEPLQFVLGELSLSGYEAYCVGGCVRDAVLGVDCKDIDIATSAEPTDVERIFTDWMKHENIKLIPTGVDHGTWTVMVDDVSFEVTTFRKDVATDGRRATVAYAKTMEEDAQRRDFTMNALYMDWQGKVFDPTGQGLADLMARKVRFVGNADERCKEDYLRILRLFRFHAHLGVGPMDAEALEAARNYAPFLEKISGERIWSELKKLLSAYSPVEALQEMILTDVLDTILPHRGDVLSVAAVVCAERDAGLVPQWTRRFAALLYSGHEIPFPASAKERQHIEEVVKYKRQGLATAHVAYQTRSRDITLDCYVLACGEGRVPCMPSEVETTRGLDARCPVDAQHLMAQGVPQGSRLGTLLKKADSLFLASQLTADRDQIMKRLPI